MHEREVLRQAKNELRDYISKLIVSTSSLHPKARLYPWLSRELAEDDSVITFNWDTLLEDALLKISNPHPLVAKWWSLLAPVFPPLDANFDAVLNGYGDLDAAPYHSGGNLIKLHGSVNLTICADVACRRHVFPFHIKDVAKFDAEYSRCLECGSELEPMLVPPHVHKSYLENTQLRFLASIAAYELAVATEIIIVGYSFPAFDFEAQSLFRAARLEPWEVGESFTNLRRVILVNPEVGASSYISKVEALLGLAKVSAHGHRIPLLKYKTVDGFLSSSKRRPTTARS
jgi:hypothetical protein